MLAFSPDGTHKDTSMFMGAVVEHLTSWLSVNPYKGCSLNCAYCFRAKWHPDNRPSEIYSVREAMLQLVSHPLFVSDITPVSINNSSTDPLLPAVRKGTFEAIRFMEDRKFKNPFVVITKLAFSDAELKLLESLEYVRPIIFASLSFIPGNIEPAPVSPRIRNIQNLSAAKIPVVMYYRPIVKGWNDSEEIMTRALLLGQQYCRSICIGGLRMSPEIRSELEKAGVNPGYESNDFHEKYFTEEIQQRLFGLYRKLNLTVPVFKHSSCAVSNILGGPNYNLLFENPGKNCTTSCPIAQQNLCFSNRRHG